jgi:hypothetical protein
MVGNWRSAMHESMISEGNRDEAAISLKEPN